MIAWLAMSGRLEVALLGPVEASLDGVSVGLTGSKLQALVALLALGAPHPTSGERLIDELWGERPPGNPTNALQAQISHARRLLGRDAVVRHGPGYRLDVGVDDVDANRLERLIKNARAERDAGNTAAALTTFEAALSTVRGQPLSGLEEFEFAARSATRLNELALSALEDMIDVQLAAAMHVEIVGRLTELCQLHPTRERLHGQLMLALYRSGRQPDALRAFQHARTLLIDEFGVEPGPILAALERSILDRDPELDLRAPLIAVPALGSHADEPRMATDGTCETPPDGGARLFGRADVLAVLSREVQAAGSGRGRTVLLAGEPGIGKTTISEHLARVGERAGAVVAWGRSFSGGGAPAFWPWSHVVDDLLARFDDDLLQAALRFRPAELARISPSVHSVVDVDPTTIDANPETAQFHVYEAVIGFVRRLSTHRPIVIVLDDLHWADPASLQLFGLMSVAAREASVLLVGAYRNVEPYISGPLAPLLIELARRGEVQRLDLEGLGPAAIKEMFEAAGASASIDSVAAIAERTRGNPFFLTEVIRLLPADQPGLDTAAVARLVPSSVRAALRSRLARLPVDTVDVLSAAAVLGGEFDVNQLAGLVELDRIRLLRAIHVAIEAGIVVHPDLRPAMYRFAHGIASQAIYDDLAPEQRCQFHRLTAEGLERDHAGEAPGPHLLAIADHWLRATPLADAERAIEAARGAAAYASGHFAPEHADRLLRAAIEACAEVPARGRRASLELTLVDELGQLLLTRSGYMAPGLDELCNRMRALCDQLDVPQRRAQALWRLAIFHLYRCEFARCAEIGEELNAIAQRGVGGVAPLGDVALGLAANHTGRLAEARRHFDRALEALESGADARAASPPETVAVLIGVYSAWNLVMMGDVEGSEQSLARAAANAASVDDSYPRAYAATLSTLMAVIRNDPAAVLQRAADGIELAEHHGHHFLAAFMVASRGWALAATDEVDTGLVDIEDGAAGVAQTGVRIWTPVFPGWLADALLRAGLADDALAAVETALRSSDASGDAWFDAELHRLRSEALRAVGRTDDADAALSTARRVATEQGALLFLERCR